MNLKDKRAAVVVAHPDDEVLWFGGLLTACSNIDVICCSIPETEPERAIKFQDVCNHLGCTYKLLPFVEVRGGHLKGLGYLTLDRYDIIYTHNHIGEYGHKHHIDVHEAVKRKFDGPIYVSGYGLPNDGIENIDFNFAEKKSIIKLYNHMSHLLGVPKWMELLKRWGGQFNLEVEGYRREN